MKNFSLIRGTDWFCNWGRVNHNLEEWTRGGIHASSILNAWLLSNWSVVGSYYQISRKHMDAYPNDFEWRLTTAKNSFLLRDTVLRLITSANLEYKRLTEKNGEAA